MSNGKMNPYERLLKLQIQSGKLILDSKRKPKVVADVLQRIVGKDDEWLERWLALDPNVIERERIEAKFQFVESFNIVEPTVEIFPDHDEYLTGFLLRHHHEFHKHNDNADTTTSPAKVYPGREISVFVFKVVDVEIAHADLLRFHTYQDAIKLGAYGIAVVYEQAKDKIPPNALTYSVEGGQRALQDTHNRVRMSEIYTHPNKPTICFSSFFTRLEQGHYLLIFKIGRTEPVVSRQTLPNDRPSGA